MSEHKCKALILDSDPDALIALQRTLENADVDTTITWDDAEARNLARTTSFDVMLIGDHPPEIRVETTIRDFRCRGVISPCLVLRTTVREMDAERLRRLGVIKVVPKRDPDRVLEEVQGTCGLKTAFHDGPTL
jgi:DNA-binding response OmpR family regulator